MEARSVGSCGATIQPSGQGKQVSNARFLIGYETGQASMAKLVCQTLLCAIPHCVPLRVLHCIGRVTILSGLGYKHVEHAENPSL
jgi:hypothetical protein